MAGHSKFKNIMHRKGSQDKKRAKVFTKILKEITVAVKLQGEDITANPRLKSAVSEAKYNNVPKENIERAIKKGQSLDAGENYEEIIYEGYGAGGVAIIVEVLTDNRNRSASEVRSCFTKLGGNLGESGSVNFLFNRLGNISFSKENILFEDLFEHATELGAEDVLEDDVFSILTSTESLHSIANELSTKLAKDYLSASFIWIPKVEISAENVDHANSVLKLISDLEDLDDVQRVFTNFDIPSEIITLLN